MLKGMKYIMKKNPPVEVSQEEVKFHVSELEPILCGPAMDIPEFEPVTLKLKDKSTLVIRPAKLEEAPAILKYLEKIMKHQKDFYDIVGVYIFYSLKAVFIPCVFNICIVFIF